MSTTLKQRISDDMKTAMRSHEKSTLGTIRLLLAAIKQREIDEKCTLSDDDILKTIIKMIKQRRDSIEQFTKANRLDLADKEKAEILTLEVYLPQQASEDEIQTAITQAVEACGATSMREMGAVMSILKSQLEGKADMARVSTQVRSVLANQ